MIAKIIQGSRFGGATEYILNKKDAELLDYKDVRAYDAKLAAQDFNLIANQNKNVKKPVIHIVISFQKNNINKLDNEKMLTIATRILNEMGFSNSQYLIVEHHDTSHPHIHILTNRIDLNNNTVSDKFCYWKLNEIRKEIEKDYPELTPANGINIENTNIEKLKGKDKIKYHIYNVLQLELKNSKTIFDLINKLKENHNIETNLKFKRGSIEDVQGIKFTYNNTTFSGSKIAKIFSYNNLIKTIENNKEEKITTKEINKNDNYKNNLLKNILAANNFEMSNALGIKKKSWDKNDELSR